MADKKIAKPAFKNRQAWIDSRKETRKPIPRSIPHSTGSLVLDDWFNGGIPGGKSVCVAGMPSNGKTTFVYLLIAQAIRDGKYPILITTEGKFDHIYFCKTVGLDPNLSDDEIEQFVYIIPDNNAQNIFNEIIAISSTRACDLIVLDSLSALVHADFAYTVDDPAYGGLALLNNRAMRRIPNFCQSNNIPFIFTSQYREGMGLYAEAVLPGGTKAIKHGTAMVLDAKARTCGPNGEEMPSNAPRLVYNFTLTAKTAQNYGVIAGSSVSTMVFVPTGEAFYDTASEIVALCEKYGLFTDKDGLPLKVNANGKTSGTSVIYFQERPLGKRGNCIELLREDGALCEELMSAIRLASQGKTAINVTGIPNSFEDNSSDIYDEDIPL